MHNQRTLDDLLRIFLATSKNAGICWSQMSDTMGSNHCPCYPLVIYIIVCYRTWTIEIVDLPINDGDFPVRYVNVFQRVMIVNDCFFVPLFAWNVRMAPLSWILRRASFAARGCLVEHRVEPWPWYLTIQKCEVFGGLPRRRIQWHLWWKKLEKWLGPGKRSSFCQILNPRTCFFSACCIPIVNKITYCEAAWKNSSRWTKKPEVSLSQMNIESLTVSTCFNKQVQNKMFSQHVGGRSLINMVSWHREIPSWNPELGKHQWLDDERSCRKKMHIADCLTMFNNLSCTFLHIYMIM